MDQSSKKRSMFGFTNLFRSSPAPANDQESKTSTPRKTGAIEAPVPRVEYGNAFPESPAKRASDAQMASRKIFGRPQGPSSKLSQSFSAADFDDVAAAAAKSASFPAPSMPATPRRMPGDNPNKIPASASFSSSTIAHAAVTHRPTNFSGTASTPRNVFRSSALYQRAGMPAFSPRVASTGLKQSLPPTTPGRASRASTADVNGRDLSRAGDSMELFKMRIPSPPRHLTGDVLEKEIPERADRSASVYADEFLSHYCPPDMDETQRRQFFCILDLRRLKYAANEVFAKKDWKINVVNFAKEYEKSRSLIMLRYGLYEFKTVKPSEAVTKEWKQRHGIEDPDGEDEATPAKKINGAPKRKAEEELTQNDNYLQAPSLGSKRPRAPDAPISSNKRKATVEDEPEESQPSKLFKPSGTPQKTPSATKSVFESIANKTTSFTPAKSTGTSGLFGSSTGSQAPGRSIFDSGAKAPATTSNIFGHLSDASKGSGNDDADEESGDDSSTNADEDMSENQEASPSEEPSAAASGGVSTPQFGSTNKAAATNGASTASSDAGESTQGKSLFDRITRGSDGQPVRKLPPVDNKASLFAAVSDQSRSVSPVKEQAPAPTNNTWNTSAPIKFASGTTTTSLFSAAAPKPAASMSFGAATPKTEAPSAAAEDAPKATATSSLFGAQPKKPEESATPSESATKESSTTQPTFSVGKAAETATSTPSLFSGLSTPKPSANPFGSTSSSSLFGQPKKDEAKKEEPKESAAPATSSLFGAQPAASTTEAPKTSVMQSSTLFGASKDAAASTPSQAPTSNLFGNATAPASQAPGSSLFGNTVKPASSLFSTPSAPASESGEPPAKKSFFATDSKPAAATFTFTPAAPAADAPKTETKNLFGASSSTTTETKNLFGGASASSTTEAPKPLFGASSADSKPLFGASSTESKPLFGATPAQGATQSGTSTPLFGNATTQPEASKSLFGNATSQPEAAKPASIFGNAASTIAPASSSMFSFSSNTQTPAASQPAASQPTGPIFSFGPTATTPAASQPAAGGGLSFNFSAGGNDSGAIINPFTSGTVSAPTSFNFGSGGDSQPSAGMFNFGGNTTTPSISFGGDHAAKQAAASFTAGSSAPNFSFGGASQPNGAPMFAAGLAPGGGTSTGTSKFIPTNFYNLLCP